MLRALHVVAIAPLCVVMPLRLFVMHQCLAQCALQERSMPVRLRAAQCLATAMVALQGSGAKVDVGDPGCQPDPTTPDHLGAGVR